jgi:hypothetical protein
LDERRNCLQRTDNVEAACAQSIVKETDVMKKITVMSAGNGGQALAGDLGLRGHEVTLMEHPRFAATAEMIRAQYHVQGGDLHSVIQANPAFGGTRPMLRRVSITVF